MQSPLISISNSLSGPTSASQNTTRPTTSVTPDAPATTTPLRTSKHTKVHTKVYRDPRFYVSIPHYTQAYTNKPKYIQLYIHLCTCMHICAKIRTNTKNRYANAPSYTPRYTNNANINKYMQTSANTQVCTYANIFKYVHEHTFKDLQCYTDVRP